MLVHQYHHKNSSFAKIKMCYFYTTVTRSLTRVFLGSFYCSRLHLKPRSL